MTFISILNCIARAGTWAARARKDSRLKFHEIYNFYIIVHNMTVVSNIIYTLRIFCFLSESFSKSPDRGPGTAVRERERHADGGERRGSRERRDVRDDDERRATPERGNKISNINVRKDAYIKLNHLICVRGVFCVIERTRTGGKEGGCAARESGCRPCIPFASNKTGINAQ